MRIVKDIYVYSDNERGGFCWAFAPEDSPYPREGYLPSGIEITAPVYWLGSWWFEASLPVNTIAGQMLQWFAFRSHANPQIGDNP